MFLWVINNMKLGLRLKALIVMSSYIIHLLLVLMKSVKDINDSNTRLSVLDVVKGINIKVFNLM